MHNNLMAFITAVSIVTLAEIGDKTQLLAMAFAAKYKPGKVMLGVFIATIFNHALAVAVGNYITRFNSLEVWIQGIAALSFIFFGLWTIRGDRLEGEENKTSKFGAVATVAIAFFIAELGDKTQLATIALATRFPVSPFGILAGTTTGMMIADGIGVCIGAAASKRIPERTIKLISAGVFIVFGFAGCFQAAVGKMGISIPISLGILALMALATGITAYLIIKNSNENNNSAAKENCSVRSSES